MGLRAIPIQRTLASLPQVVGVVFSFQGMTLATGDVIVEPVLVFSPAMFLPAVVARAESLAKFLYGSSDVLGVKRSINEMGILGVEADIAAVDGSPQGIIRATLMTYAAEQVFDLFDYQARSSPVDLASIRSYYRGEGALALRGERDDVLTVDPTTYDWTQK